MCNDYLTTQTLPEKKIRAGANHWTAQAELRQLLEYILLLTI